MRCAAAMILSLGLTVTLNTATAEAVDIDDLVDFSGAIPGRLYVPPEAADPAEPRPFIFFLHGGTVAGTDNRRHITSGSDALFDAAKQRGAYLYYPQSPTGWNNGGWRSSTEIMTMIDQAIDQENVDPDRLYVTGLSTGGGGTWDMLNHVDDRFAAAMPISTATLQSNLDAANFLGTPIWAFHSRNDNPASIRNIINDTLSAGGEPTLTFPSTSDTTTFEYVNERLQLKYTEFPTAGHFIWSQVWSTAEVMDWMFTQTLSTTTLEGIGDFNEDDRLDVADLDALIAAVPNDTQFDLDGNGIVDTADRDVWITDIKNTFLGDTDLDGQVNSADLNALALSWRSTNATSWSQGDFNGDGNVNSADLNTVGLNWRKTAAAQASTAPVPEPSTLLLTILGLAFIGRRPKGC